MPMPAPIPYTVCPVSINFTPNTIKESHVIWGSEDCDIAKGNPNAILPHASGISLTTYVPLADNKIDVALVVANK